MKRYLTLLTAVMVIMAVVPGYSATLGATRLGVGIGIDPTGITLASLSAVTEVSPTANVRANIGFSSLNAAWLMLIDGMVLAHYPVKALDPFVGAGIGGAFTTAGTNALILEGTIGTNIALFPALTAFIDVRYIARFTPYGINTGPLYEAGLAFNF